MTVKGELARRHAAERRQLAERHDAERDAAGFDQLPPGWPRRGTPEFDVWVAALDVATSPPLRHGAPPPGTPRSRGPRSSGSATRWKPPGSTGARSRRPAMAEPSGRDRTVLAYIAFTTCTVTAPEGLR